MLLFPEFAIIDSIEQGLIVICSNSILFWNVDHVDLSNIVPYREYLNYYFGTWVYFYTILMSHGQFVGHKLSKYQKENFSINFNQK